MGLFYPRQYKNMKGTGRLEDDRTYPIKEFFEDQKQVEHYEIKDKEHWVVDVEGSIHLCESDLTDGELFFKIGKLTGDLYCHCRHFKPSVVPAELGGEIIFVLDEEELAKYRTNTAGSTKEDSSMMHAISAYAPTDSDIRKNLVDALSTYVNYGCSFDIDEIKDRIANEQKNRSRYKLRMEAKKPGNREIECEFYVTNDENDTPLKLTAIEKAVYIVFILHDKGLCLTDKPSFKAELGLIYSQIVGRVEDLENGILGDNFSVTSLNTCRFRIREAIKEKIWNSQIVDEFAIEGYRGKPFFVKEATNKLRTQIRNIFVL